MTSKANDPGRRTPQADVQVRMREIDEKELIAEIGKCVDEVNEHVKRLEKATEVSRALLDSVVSR